MSRIFECDWCHVRFDDRAQVASADLTVGQAAESLHICARCVPEWLVDEFPEERKVLEEGDREITTDGGREMCVVCAHLYDRDEHDHCPNCHHSSLDEFATDGGVVESPQCQRCGADAMEALHRRSPPEHFWICPQCLTDFGEWLEAGR